MKKKLHTYRGESLTVTFDSTRCIHTGRCLQGAPAAFDVNDKPWVHPDAVSPEQVVATVQQCPSGALHVVDAETPAATENTLELRPNGPIYARGRLTLRKLDGEVLLDDDRMALCRCGASQNKPLCDNSHREAGFRAPAALGRLSADGGDGPAGPLAISAAPNGPLLLDGPAEIRGGKDSVQVRKAALCRCGLSGNKPYCDGSHATGAFRTE
ncbi:MAG: CDGSH iron-sulfur domain-containing protein [Acidobacteria bacterium]|nr:CDGSH iron-sulfur domain-containing protein [Acidobacteriota bacterium]